ncbi:hypothetical protein BAE44_0023675 [Dichanthelium oligosanthes]|uniref:Uncharacterized protein n=1 Tax=Dichanthelium oligosanthes TaxID=888268 RepID=A0A1E5UR03_9POAL|nr:hypothetical protein BAE44_0023675 [Dichanthelium oligosanthes]
MALSVTGNNWATIPQLGGQAMASSPTAKKDAATPRPLEPPKSIDFTKPPGKAEQTGGGEERRPRKRGRKLANGREEPLGRGLASWSPPPRNSRHGLAPRARSWG